MGKKSQYPDDYFAMTPGARAARRGSTSARPWHQHWAKEQAIAICDYVSSNPWIEATLGRNLDVSVRLAEDGSSVQFVFSRASSQAGGMGGVPPMLSDGGTF